MENTMEQIAFEAERLQIMKEHYQVFSCSGRVEGHTPECDGNCEVVALSGLDRAIVEELQKWDELEMVPIGTLPQTPIPGVGVNTFHLEVGFNALIELLKEKGIIEEDETNERYAQKKLERLKAIREMNEERIRESQRMERIAAPGVTDKKIILPAERRTKLL